jgi:hypothetical protein
MDVTIQEALQQGRARFLNDVTGRRCVVASQGIHEDMRASFKRYPQKWGLKGPDRNIDHRRVPNIQAYLQRQGYAVQDQRYAPGDIVTWDLGRGLAHIGIVSDRKSFNQTPLIIHNIGQGAREENILHQYAITGHYRLKR